jgi:hypothetical protein
MKRIMFIVLLILFFLGILAFDTAFANPTAYLNLINSPLGVGDTFEVDVFSDGDDIALDLISFGFDVSFDAGNVFNYNGYTLGAGFDDDSVGPRNIAGSAFPGIPDNNALLATLFFETISIGTDTLNISGIYDGIFSGLYYELPDFSLTGYDINDSLEITTVPIPSSVFLLSVGLIGLICSTRRLNG